MRPILKSLVAVLVLASASSAFAGVKTPEQAEAKLAKMLEGRTAAPPLTCINPRSVDTVEIIDRTAIVYRMKSGLFYVNRPETGATSLDRDDTIVTRTIGAQLCRNDAVTLVDGGSRFPSGFISLGQFVPYPRAKP